MTEKNCSECALYRARAKEVDELFLNELNKCIKYYQLQGQKLLTMANLLLEERTLLQEQYEKEENSQEPGVVTTESEKEKDEKQKPSEPEDRLTPEPVELTWDKEYYKQSLATHALFLLTRDGIRRTTY